MFVPFTIGCDPEFFLRNADGAYVSSVGLIDGTKKEPFMMHNGSFIMKDNVAVEFGMPPASTEEEWQNTLIETYDAIHDYLPPGLQLSADPSARFPLSELMTPEAREFGCEPDYNAWTKEQNEAPCATDRQLRSCGGHIHVGYVKGELSEEFLTNRMGRFNTVRMMDANHGIVSVVLDNSEAAKQRRELYGKAGCFRPTEYGIEYRTLSNFWMKAPVYQTLMYRLTSDVVLNLSMQYDRMARFVGRNGNGIIATINEGRELEAKKFIKNVLYPLWDPSTVAAYEDAVNYTLEVSNE